MTSPTRLMAMTLAGGLLLVGCADTDGSQGVATLSTGTDSAGEQDVGQDGDTEEVMLDFAQCMRDEGVDFADPVPGEDGQLRFAPPGGGEAGVDADTREAMQTAVEACGDLLERLDVGGGPGGRGEVRIDTEAVLAFAECMRDNGVTDFPDPTADGLPDWEQMQALDRTSDTFVAATETCRDEVGLQGPGAGIGGAVGEPRDGGSG